MDILVYEMNIRAGEPEMQVVARRLKNLGELIVAATQWSARYGGAGCAQGSNFYLSCAGYGPWRASGAKRDTRIRIPSMNRFLSISRASAKRGILIVPSNISWDEENQRLISDGSRVCYLSKNATVKPGQKRGQVAETLRAALLQAFDHGLVRVVPREADETFEAGGDTV